MNREYRVSLESFAGPLDLLLFLVKKEEVDIHDIPIARILEQYLEHVQQIQELDLDKAGEFLVMAATLMVIKSRMLLPAEDVDLTEEIDPRYELVAELLEYKRFKDSAEILEQRRERRWAKLGRPESARPTPLAKGERELEETSLLDLVAAFQRILESVGRELGKGHPRLVRNIRPVSAYARKLGERLSRERSLLFTELLGGIRERGEIIAYFLAVLLLIKRQMVVCAQVGPEDIRLIYQEGGQQAEFWEGDRAAFQ